MLWWWQWWLVLMVRHAQFSSIAFWNNKENKYDCYHCTLPSLSVFLYKPKNFAHISEGKRITRIFGNCHSHNHHLLPFSNIPVAVVHDNTQQNNLQCDNFVVAITSLNIIVHAIYICTPEKFLSLAAHKVHKKVFMVCTIIRCVSY